MTAVRHQVVVFVELSVVAMRFLLNSTSKLSMYEIKTVLFWIKLHNLYPTDVMFHVHILSNVYLKKKVSFTFVILLPLGTIEI